MECKIIKTNNSTSIPCGREACHNIMYQLFTSNIITDELASLKKQKNGVMRQTT